MDIRTLRLARNWSQEELAQCSGLSVRTIQRIEKGGEMSLETRKALGAAFDMDLNPLEADNNTSVLRAGVPESQTSMVAGKQKRFYRALVVYGLVMSLLLVINLIVTPGYFWVIWPALGWGLAIALKGLKLFGEKSLMERRVGA